MYFLIMIYANVHQFMMKQTDFQEHVHALMNIIQMIVCLLIVKVVNKIIVATVLAILRKIRLIAFVRVTLNN